MTQWPGNCGGFEDIWRRPPLEEGASEEILVRVKWWDVIFGDHTNLRSEQVSASRLVLGWVFSGDGGRFSLNLQTLYTDQELLDEDNVPFKSGWDILSRISVSC